MNQFMVTLIQVKFLGVKSLKAVLKPCRTIAWVHTSLAIVHHACVTKIYFTLLLRRVFSPEHKIILILLTHPV